MSTINPYVNFNGDTEEAFGLYKSVFGGEFAMVMRYGDGPGCEEMQLSDEDKTKIMHIALPIGTSGDVLMGTDMLESMGMTATYGNSFSITYSPDSKEEADRVYAGLVADGGTVLMPLQDQFWGSYHGALRDRFGIQWMIDFDPRYANGGHNG